MCRLVSCCCMSLQTCTLIIGILYLIGSTLSLAGLMVAIVKLFEPQLFYNRSDLVNDFRYFYEGSAIELGFEVICFVAFAVCCLQVAVDVLLIVAAVQRKAAFVVPWFVLNIVLLVFYLGGLAGVSIVGFISSSSYSLVNVVSITPIVVAVFFLVISIAFMVVVRSFYDNVKTLY